MQTETWRRSRGKGGGSGFFILQFNEKKDGVQQQIQLQI